MLTVFCRFAFHSQYARWRYRAAFMLYGLIIVLGALPGARHAVGEVASGWALHGAAYATLTFLVYTGLNSALLKRAGQTLGLVAAMGACDELIQGVFPYRQASWGDWAIDIVAALLMLTLLVFVTHKNSLPQEKRTRIQQAAYPARKS